MSSKRTRNDNVFSSFFCLRFHFNREKKLFFFTPKTHTYTHTHSGFLLFFRLFLYNLLLSTVINSCRCFCCCCYCRSFLFFFCISFSLALSFSCVLCGKIAANKNKNTHRKTALGDVENVAAIQHRLTDCLPACLLACLYNIALTALFCCIYAGVTF